MLPTTNQQAAAAALEDIDLQDESHFDHQMEPTLLGQNKRSAALDFPMHEWVRYRDETLDELHRHDGRADYIHMLLCPGCGDPIAPTIKCLDCFRCQMVCTSCTVKSHAFLPLHRIKVWNGHDFKTRTLKALGLKIQLGPHADGVCPCPVPGHQDFVVIDLELIQEVAVVFCGCARAEPHHRQLLRVAWYPATVAFPHTACTFNVLRSFHILSLQSKCSAYNYYRSLARSTDNTGLEPPKDRYTGFIQMVRQWRHLKLLKRAGWGLAITGVGGTKAGELVLPCAACPHPGINLPEGWELFVITSMWLYTQYLLADANFRMARKYVSSEAHDPGLGTGWAYFVEDAPYQSHLANFGDQTDTSTCHEHKAMKQANTRGDRLHTTGVGAVACRHQLVRPTGVGDLQRGEKFANMDYIFLSACLGLLVNLLVASYDIVCQWSVHFMRRMETLPAHLRLNPLLVLIYYLIPKFHLLGHGLHCQTRFSFNLFPGAACTDGEGIERVWSVMNGCVNSTKEMGPSARHDTLDDNFGDWNWRLLVGMGTTFRKKLREAGPECNKHAESFHRLCLSLNATLVKDWTCMAEAWEANHSKPNPYETTVHTRSQADVRREIAEEEAVDASLGLDPVDDMSAGEFLTKGLELEEAQARLRKDITILGKHATSTQIANVQESRHTLRRRIEKWRLVQDVYMPIARTLHAAIPDNSLHDDPTPTELLQLVFPSGLTPSINQSPALNALADQEFRLRRAQADDALHELRQLLCVRAHLLGEKRRHICGQRPNTRANALIESNSARTRKHANRYRRARAALSILGPRREGWETVLQPSQESDITPLHQAKYSDDEKKNMKNHRRVAPRNVDDPLHREEQNVDTMADAEGRRTMSWIWMTPGVLSARSEGGEDEAMGEALRVEWAHARARAERWSEEVELVEEEMRRICAYYEFVANQWLEKVQERVSGERALDPELQEGLQAYGHQHARLYRSFSRSFALMWEPVRADVKANAWVAGSNTKPRLQVNDMHTEDVELWGGAMDEPGDGEDNAPDVERENY